MKDNFDYKQVPKAFLHCLHTPCPHSTECLRYIAALKADNDREYFSVVNPHYVSAKEKECPYFMPDSLTRFALGITHIYDNLPHAKAVKIKEILYNHFRRNTYYRIRNKERLIKPSEQEYIRKVFRREGVLEEPAFDQYVDQYDW
ncbi:hypothetical protein D0T50_03030 [Bacteroides sp. 214]|uniref:DUF6078 family protein n=1 Tax=Bacteroides sp. 214 TaxID=2302935 RepID=UPI0013D80544|nr:DUF6078 family protein [Bacteroides sp. 214]NDW11861.1 hypothetical protein [Bacteroides sp. 214]